MILTTPKLSGPQVKDAVILGSIPDDTFHAQTTTRK
jgi:hypothetical protein